VALRGHRVLLDSDLADLYGVELKALKQVVRRNRERFPDDFMFQLTTTERRIVKAQAVTSRSTRGRRDVPCAFTEQGVAMLSSVLRSGPAIRMNLQIMRAFARMRALIGRNRDPVFVSYAARGREPLQRGASPHRPSR
jgi:hypothetical protein